MVRREEYTSIVNYVSLRGAVSYHRARTTLSELRKMLQEASLRGDDLHIPGVFKIEYTTTNGYIFKNNVFGLEEQIKAVSKNLGMGSQEVEKLVKLYYRRVKELVEIGYQVNVMGIGYIVPKVDEEGVYCDTRVSPVLAKPEVADFLLLDEDGTLLISQLSGEELRYSIELEEDFKIPYQVVKDTNFEMEVVDI